MLARKIESRIMLPNEKKSFLESITLVMYQVRKMMFFALYNQKSQVVFGCYQETV